MTYRQARATGKVFAFVGSSFSHIYYPNVTVSECSDESVYAYWPGYYVDGVMVDDSVIDYTVPDLDDPNLVILGDYEQPDVVKKCDCDFYSVVLVSGCRCG